MPLLRTAYLTSVAMFLGGCAGYQCYHSGVGCDVIAQKRQQEQDQAVKQARQEAKARFDEKCRAQEAAAPENAGPKIEGAFGIHFGEDIRPYLEGTYAVWESPSMVPGALPNTFRYMLLKAPLDLRCALPDASFTYMGLANKERRVIELAVEARLPGYCRGSAELKSATTSFRSKFRVVRPQSNDYRAAETYGDDENNRIELSCGYQDQNLSIRYTSSRLIEDYVATVRTSIDKRNTQMEDSMRKSF